MEANVEAGAGPAAAGLIEASDQIPGIGGSLTLKRNGKLVPGPAHLLPPENDVHPVNEAVDLVGALHQEALFAEAGNDRGLEPTALRTVRLRADRGPPCVRIRNQDRGEAD